MWLRHVGVTAWITRATVEILEQAYEQATVHDGVREHPVRSGEFIIRSLEKIMERLQNETKGASILLTAT